MVVYIICCIFAKSNSRNMEIDEKIKLNKLIRKYEGNNSFILSLQKQLKSNKYLTKVEYKNKNIKILTDKQYLVAEEIIKNENINTKL
ncbi:MAG: hypothetical protein M0R46_14185 [Candidatus Muirbacterium halophilum]|nr:hypothetical protein [Candidatus Muirbacterium halophilum]